MWMILFLIVAIQSVQCCIPLGIGSGCDCQVNPGCGRCLPPIPPVQRTCAGCAFSNDGIFKLKLNKRYFSSTFVC
jgi:hypothetical protein